MRRIVTRGLVVTVVTAVTTVTVAPAAAVARAAGRSAPPYAATAWPTIHADSRNSNSVTAPVADRLASRWTALDGATTMTTPVQGPEGHVYVTTGRGPGFSSLHAYDSAGHLLWESEPYETTDDLDSCALGSSPIVDREGDLYLSDCNQLWALHPDGAVKWVVPLPVAGEPFITAVFTKDGRVGGVTTGGKVAFHDRVTGKRSTEVLDLPGSATAEKPVPKAVWAGGLVDPALRKTMLNVFLGNGVEVANTPAVDPRTGRIFVVGGGPTAEHGTVYGLDVDGNAIRVAFATAIGPAAAASPVLSPTGRRAYTVDGVGKLWAVDTSSGAALWNTSVGQTGGAVAVGYDGSIYVAAKREVVAVSPAGARRWSRAFDALALEYVPEAGGLPRQASVNSVVTVAAGRLVLAVVVGHGVYGYTSPYRTLLVKLDRNSGQLLGSPTVMRDSNEGFVAPAAGGNVYATSGAIMSSLFYYGLNSLLPVDVRMPRPLGGVEVFAPV